MASIQHPILGDEIHGGELPRSVSHLTVAIAYLLGFSESFKKPISVVISLFFLTPSYFRLLPTSHCPFDSFEFSTTWDRI